MSPSYEPMKCSQESDHGSDEHLIAEKDRAGEFNFDEYPKRPRQLWPWALHGVLFIIYSAAYLIALNSKTFTCPSYEKAYSPANEALKYHPVSYHGGLHAVNEFRGTPRPELDKAWADLLEHNNIRLSEDELKRMNRTALQLSDKSGYFGQLSAYHHLHCLKYIRQVLHPEYYDTDTDDRDEHVDHCIDDLRQALMCHADTSIVTFGWKSPDWRRPWPDFNIDHTCVDWDAIVDWTAKRSFNIFDQQSVVHPQLGIVFPLVDGKLEYVSHGPDMHIVWPKDWPKDSGHSV